jgi:hypothetical protein
VKTLREVLTESDRAGVAVGHFNISELVALKAVTAAARELNVPVLVGVSEGERDFMGVRQVAALVRSIYAETPRSCMGLLLAVAVVIGVAQSGLRGVAQMDRVLGWRGRFFGGRFRVGGLRIGASVHLARRSDTADAGHTGCSS